MYESIIIRGVLLVLGVAGVWWGWPRKVLALDPDAQIVAGLIFACGMFAIIGTVFAK